MTQPDPDPSDTTGLDAGNSFQPGETPPAEGSTSGLSAPQASPKGRTPVGVVVVLAVLMVALVAFFLARLVGLG